MALAAKLRTAFAPDNSAHGPTPRVADDAEFAAASALLTTFREHLALLERQKMRLILERELDGKPADPRSSNDTNLRARVAALRADPPFTPATPGRAALPNAPSPTIAAALAIVDGAPMPPTLDHGAQLVEIARRHAAVRQAIFEQTEECDRITNEVSFRLCLEIQPRWDAAQVRMFRAAQALAAAAEHVKELRRDMIDAGIRPLSHVIKMAPVRSPLVLGSEEDWNSELAQWARLLKEWNLIGAIPSRMNSQRCAPSSKRSWPKRGSRWKRPGCSSVKREKRSRPFRSSGMRWTKPPRRSAERLPVRCMADFAAAMTRFVERKALSAWPWPWWKTPRRSLTTSKLRSRRLLSLPRHPNRPRNRPRRRNESDGWSLHPPPRPAGRRLLVPCDDRPFLSGESLGMKFIPQSQFHAAARAGQVRNVGVVCPIGKLLSTDDAGSRAVSFLFSDSSVDLMGDTISATGWDLGPFRRNPVVPFSHDTASPPIGRVPNVFSDGTSLRGDIEFATAEVYPFADTIFRLVQAGFVRACSVGFLPLEFSWSKDPDRPGGIDFKRQRLLEVSVCVLPANSNALVGAQASGIGTAAIARWADGAMRRGNNPLLSGAQLKSLHASASSGQRSVDPRSYAADLATYESAKDRLARAKARAARLGETAADRLARAEARATQLGLYVPPAAPTPEQEAEAQRRRYLAGYAGAAAALAWW